MHHTRLLYDTFLYSTEAWGNTKNVMNHTGLLCDTLAYSPDQNLGKYGVPMTG